MAGLAFPCTRHASVPGWAARSFSFTRMMTDRMASLLMTAMLAVVVMAAVLVIMERFLSWSVKMSKRLLKQCLAKFVGPHAVRDLVMDLDMFCCAVHLHDVCLNVEAVNSKFRQYAFALKKGSVKRLTVNFWPKATIELDGLELRIVPQAIRSGTQPSAPCAPWYATKQLQEDMEESWVAADIFKHFAWSAVWMLSNLLKHTFLGAPFIFKQTSISIEEVPDSSSIETHCGIMLSCYINRAISLVSGSKTVLGYRLGIMPLSMRNEVSFQQMCFELGSFGREKCEHLSLGEVRSQGLHAPQIFLMENNTGLSGHLKVSINGKRGCSAKPKVDADAYLEPVRLHVKDTQFQRLLNLTASFLEIARMEEVSTYSCGSGLSSSINTSSLWTVTEAPIYHRGGGCAVQDSQVMKPAFCCSFLEAFSFLPLLSGLSWVTACSREVPLVICVKIAEVSAILDRDVSSAQIMDAVVGGIDLSWQVGLDWRLRLMRIELFARQQTQQHDLLVDEVDINGDRNFHSKRISAASDSLRALAEQSLPEFPVAFAKESQAQRQAPEASCRKCFFRISDEGRFSGLQVKASHKMSQKNSGQEKIDTRDMEELIQYEVHLQPLLFWEDVTIICTLMHWVDIFCNSSNGVSASSTASSSNIENSTSIAPSPHVARKMEARVSFLSMRVWVCLPHSTVSKTSTWNSHLLCLDIPLTTVELILQDGSNIGKGGQSCAGSVSVALFERSDIYIITPFIQRALAGEHFALRCHVNKAFSISPSCCTEPVALEVFHRPNHCQEVSLAEYTWTRIARGRERGAGMGNTEADQHLMHVDQPELHEAITFHSMTSIVVAIPKAKVMLLASHYFVISKIYTLLVQAGAAVSQRGSTLMQNQDVGQISVSLDIREAELNLPSNTEKAMTWRSYLISIEKTQLLYAARLGMTNNASYFWARHGNGNVKGSLADVCQGDSEVQLLTWTNDAVDQPNGGRTHVTNSAGLEVSMISWPGRSDTADTLIWAVMESCMFTLHGCNLDWLPGLIAILSQADQTTSFAVSEQTSLSETEVTFHMRPNAGHKSIAEQTVFLSKNNALFTLELHSAALCYRPLSDAIFRSEGTIKQFDLLSGSVVTASGCIFNSVVPTTDSQEYNVVLQDMALLVTDNSTLIRTATGLCRNESVHSAGYVKVAGIAKMGALVHTNVNGSNALDWKIVSTGGQLQLDTCIDTATVLSQLVNNLWQLFDNELEHSAARNSGTHDDRYDSSLEEHGQHTLGTLAFQDWQVGWRLYTCSNCSTTASERTEINGFMCAKQRELCMEWVLQGLNFQLVTYPSWGWLTSRLVVSAQEVGIYDSSKNAPWRKILGGHLSTSAEVWKLELESVRANCVTTTQEYRLYLQPPHLRLRVGHWHVDFLSKFFTGLKDEEPGSVEVPNFETVEVYSCRVQIDYAPCKLEETRAVLAPGDHIKLVNQMAFKYMELELKHVSEKQVYGWEMLFRVIADRWWEDVVHNQTFNLLKGVGPIRSLLALQSAAAELLRIPADEYDRDPDRLVEGMARGAKACMQGIFNEALIGGVQLAAGAEEILSRAGSSLAGSSSLGSGQPWSAQEGTQKALERLCEGFGRAESALIHEPWDAFRSSGRKRDAVKSFLRAAPGIAVASLGDGVGAAHLYLRGVRNGLHPWRRMEFEDRHSLPPSDW